jgi:hypothetical protein
MCNVTASHRSRSIAREQKRPSQGLAEDVCSTEVAPRTSAISGALGR